MGILMTIESLNLDVDKRRGKAFGWPAELTYLATEGADVVDVTIRFAESVNDSVWKRTDPWGLAFVYEVQKRTKKPVRPKFSVRDSGQVDKCQYEALKRRVSYLAESNNLQLTLLKDGAVDRLYSVAELAHRPDTEVIRSDFTERGDDDTAGRLEKDFQAYLFGKGLHEDTDPDTPRTNERLALFGPDFVGIGKLKSAKKHNGYRVEREFPTGVFDKEVKEANRILSTEYVDLVTLNRERKLAIIELKIDDARLEVISQVLNYALYFYSYRAKLAPLLEDKLNCDTFAPEHVTYLVSNTFHKKFPHVWPYYNRGPLTLRQVIMGYMPKKPIASGAGSTDWHPGETEAMN
jgi:hypothetical protein